jgi:hypothetical protein
MFSAVLLRLAIYHGVLRLPALAELHVVARGDAGMAQDGRAAQLAAVRRQNGALRAELGLLVPPELGLLQPTPPVHRNRRLRSTCTSARKRRTAATAATTTAAND